MPLLHNHIILLGFKSTGKSVVGKKLAELYKKVLSIWINASYYL
jgi:shikimate kinase